MKLVHLKTVFPNKRYTWTHPSTLENGTYPIQQERRTVRRAHF